MPNPLIDDFLGYCSEVAPTLKQYRSWVEHAVTRWGSSPDYNNRVVEEVLISHSRLLHLFSTAIHLKKDVGLSPDQDRLFMNFLRDMGSVYKNLSLHKEHLLVNHEGQSLRVHTDIIKLLEVLTIPYESPNSHFPPYYLEQIVDRYFKLSVDFATNQGHYEPNKGVLAKILLQSEITAWNNHHNAPSFSYTHFQIEVEHRGLCFDLPFKRGYKTSRF